MCLNRSTSHPDALEGKKMFGHLFEATSVLGSSGDRVNDFFFVLE